MSPFSRRDVPAKAGSSLNTTNRDKQWISRLRDWKAPQLKLPKLPRAAFSNKSQKGKGIEIEAVPETKSTPGHDSEEVNQLPPPAPPENVPGFSSVPRETSSSPISNYSFSLLNLFPLDFKNKLPPPVPPDNVPGFSPAPSAPRETSSSPIPIHPFPVLSILSSSLRTPSPISERHSSSSSDYGHSYRSRSSSGPSVYHGSDPTFPYPLLYNSFDSKPNNHRSLDRQSSGSWSTISSMPELNRPPSPDCGPSTLSVDQSKVQSKAQLNTIFDRFIENRDGEGGAQFLSEPDKKANGSPMVETKAVHDISARRPKPGRVPWERQSSGPSRSISRPPPFTNRAFSPRDTDTPSLAKINAFGSRPRKGGAEMPPNPNSGPPMMQTKNVHDTSARRQAAIANPFPFPFIEDSDDEIIIEATSHLSVVQSDVGRCDTRIPFSSPIIEDDWG